MTHDVTQDFTSLRNSSQQMYFFEDLPCLLLIASHIAAVLHLRLYYFNDVELVGVCG